MTRTPMPLETIGWDIPVAIMPMPLMGATAPASVISTVFLANVEFLAMLCLVQAAAPGTGVIYAPVSQSIEPHTWRYTGGAIENSLFGAATTSMGRFYGFPVEAATGGTDQSIPAPNPVMNAPSTGACLRSPGRISWSDRITGRLHHPVP